MPNPNPSPSPSPSPSPTQVLAIGLATRLSPVTMLLADFAGCLLAAALLCVAPPCEAGDGGDGGDGGSLGRFASPAIPAPPMRKRLGVPAATAGEERAT